MTTTFEENRFYHVFNRGNNRENIFLEEANYLYFLQLTKKYLSPIAEMYCYCLLPNHFHFVLKIKEQEQLPTAIKTGKMQLHQPFSNLFNAYAKAINKKYKRRGSLFQEHLKKKHIDGPEYLINLILYVHLNPIHHQLYNDFSKYTYSSYSSILSKSPTDLMREEVIALFDSIDNFIYVHQEQKIKKELMNKLIEMDFL